jgi:transcriptional regulator with XRE-family HTH domain
MQINIEPGVSLSEQFSEVFTKLRYDAGLTVREAARLADLAPGTVVRLENQHKFFPKLPAIQRLLDVYLNS